MSLLGSNIPIMSFQENAATRYSTTSRALVRFEGTPVYLNERQLSGAGNNDLNVAEGREPERALVGRKRTSATDCRPRLLVPNAPHGYASLIATRQKRQPALTLLSGTARLSCIHAGFGPGNTAAGCVELV
jgi:hypothetical protein